MGNDLLWIDVLAALDAAESILIVTHERPDGDAIGSVLASAMALSTRPNRVVTALIPSGLPAKYAPFGALATFQQKIPDGFATDLCLCLDSGNAERLDFGKECATNPLKSCPVVLNIDHHPDNTHFGTMNLVEPEKSSTCEVLFDIFSPAGLVNSNVADLLLIGVLMDTGGLRFSNTTPAVLRKTASLMDAGANYARTVKLLLMTKPLRVFQLESELWSAHLRFHLEGRFACCRLPEDVLARHGVPLGETDGVVDAIRTVDGVLVSAVLYRVGDEIKISLRSEDRRFPVAPIARSLGGGGHELAAGCKIPDSTFDAVEQMLLEKVSQLLPQKIP